MSTQPSHTYRSRETQPVQLLHPAPAGPVSEVLYYQGPTIDAAGMQRPEQVIAESGLSRTIIRHADHPDRASRRVARALQHLATNGQVILDMHGVNVGRHFVESGLVARADELTEAMLRRLLQQCAARFPGSHPAGRPVIHAFSCGIGKLRDELRPGTSLWRSAWILLYAGKRPISYYQQDCAFSTAFSYVQHCHRQGLDVDPKKLFLLAGLRRGECMTLLGGDLDGPVTWHAPTSLEDLDINAPLADRLDACDSDLDRMAEAMRGLSAEEQALLPSATDAAPDLLLTLMKRADRLGIVKLLRDEPELVNELMPNGMRPIHMAVQLQSLPLLKLLLRRGARPTATDANGHAALIWAVGNPVSPGDVATARKIAEHLLQHGVDPDQRSGTGRPALICAIEAGRIDAVGLLLDHGANPDAGSPDGSALAAATRINDDQAIALLTARGAR